MANRLVLLFFFLLALSVVDIVTATPVVIPQIPIRLSIPAVVPPLQSAQIVMDVCHACRTVMQFCQCMAVNSQVNCQVNSQVNDAAYSQQQRYPPQPHLESAPSPSPSPTPSYASPTDEAQLYPYETLQPHEPVSYYSQYPQSSAPYSYTTSQSSREFAWVDKVYTPPDRADPRLGNYYGQSRNETLLNPVIAYLSSSSLSPGPSPLDDPAGIDSASIDPRLLRLPTDNVDDPRDLKDCPHCGKSFVLKSLKRHIQRQHNPQIARYYCDAPNCVFSSIKETDVDRHMMKHTHQQPFGCDFCSKRFSRADNQKRHVRALHPDLFVASP
jgi:hypothetical protein